MKPVVAIAHGSIADPFPPIRKVVLKKKITNHGETKKGFLKKINNH